MVNIEHLTKLNWYLIPKHSIVFDPKVRGMCCFPYKNHPKGCPNYNKSLTCPPKSKYRQNEVNSYQFHYLFIATLDFKSYREQMIAEHPNWTLHDGKITCVLYWQNSVKKLLREYIEDRLHFPISQIYTQNQIDLMGKKKRHLLLTCGSGFGEGFQSMESAGIHVIQTLRNNQIDIEEKPNNIVKLVCLYCCDLCLYCCD